MSKIFIDTNILIYNVDNNDPKKKSISRSILRKITIEDNPVISTQVIQEFYVAITKKLNIEPLLAKDIIHSFEHFEIVSVNINIIKEAIDCSIINRLSFWDSLIICAAENTKCEYLYSEDLNHGQIIRGVKIVNPFLSIANSCPMCQNSCPL